MIDNKLTEKIDKKTEVMKRCLENSIFIISEVISAKKLDDFRDMSGLNPMGADAPDINQIGVLKVAGRLATELYKSVEKET